MADTKITALTALTAADPANDVIPIVDVSDTTMAASGTTKKISVNNILSSSPTASGALTVTGLVTAGSATITGDLTVDTSVLKVDSLNNRVGIGTASPGYDLEVAGSVRSTVSIRGNFAGGTDIGHLRFVNSNGSIVGDIFCQNTNGGASDSAYLSFNTTSSGTSAERYRIASDGVATWSNVGGVAGTAMTLDSSGNLGLSVTPSAWSGYKAIGVVNQGFNIYSSTTLSVGGITSNGYYNGSNWLYLNSASSGRYEIAGNSHQWYTAPSGTAGNAITFTQAMTLDASGNLLCGVTSAIFNSRLRVKTSSTSASDYGVYVADSADALVFALRNDGLIYTGTKTASPYNNTTASAANVFVAADGTLGRSTSSLKYKKDVKDSIHGLADVLKLRSVTYKSKNGDDTVFGGLIAEEVHAAGLTEFVAYAPDKTPDSINYGNMVSLLVSAIKELTARVQTLETR